MQSRLDFLIEDLEKKLFFMLDLVSQILNSSKSYYQEHSDSFLQSVDRLEETVNEYENKIDEHAIRIFALQQPFAFDLRKVMMAIKINIDLERIGDLSYTIAHRVNSTKVNDFYGMPPEGRVNPIIVQNFETTIEMLLLIKQAFTNKEIEGFKNIIDLDSKIDITNSQVFRESLQGAAKNPDHINFYMNQITISKSLERVGDHITNIAQDFIYVFTGINIKHRDRNTI